MTTNQPMSPEQIAEAAERIYEEQFRAQYEGSHNDEFLAIDVLNETAHLGTYPEDALGEAEKASPNGTFYLIRIGASATFNVGYTGEHTTDMDGALRSASYRAPEIRPA